MAISPPDYMECALSLARLALGHTSPNPAVGAVVVKNGMIVGLGHTQPPGSAHAEIVALRQAGEAATGATMYVSLEPCCHYGRTPPCTRAIIDSGISEVHVAMFDPNPLVSGKGIRELEKAGIMVCLNEYADKAKQINEAYIKFITSSLPFVTAKFAMSLDGKIATKTGDSKWIGDDAERKYVHGLRHTCDAIMVGANTITIDDPRLTARGGCGKGGTTKTQPVRVIVDGKGLISPAAQIFKQPGKTIVAVCNQAHSENLEALERSGCEILRLPETEGLVDLKELLKELGRRGITSVLVEGGSTLLGNLFDRGLVDKVMAFISPIIIGGEKARTAVGGDGVKKVAQALTLRDSRSEKIGSSVLVTGYTA